MTKPRRRMLPRLRTLCAALGFACLVTFSFAAEANGKRAFDIAAGDATTTLKQFAQQSGVELLYSIDDLKGVKTVAVRRELAPREALELMLSGSGLTVTQGKTTGALAINRGPDPNVPRAASAVTNAAHQAAHEEAAVELSPFTVNADRDDGYVAGETLAGSRVKTSLRETAASISIMTEEFIRDIGATSLTEVLEYGNNVQLERSDAGVLGSSTDDNSTFESFDTFRIRGQTATVARNYFAWRLPTDTFNIERIEESRGPNSILFGVASAGGVISSMTKTPVLGRSFRRGAFSTGTYGTYRGTIDVNQSAMDGRLGVRFNAVADRTANYRLWAYKESPRVDLAAKYNLTRQTNVRVEYETGHIHEVVPRNGNMLDGGVLTYLSLGRPTYATPVAANGGIGLGRLSGTRHLSFIANNHTLVDMSQQNIGFNSGDQLGNEAAVDKSVNPAGPGAKRDSPFNAVSAFIEHQLAQHTFLELGYNHQDYHMRVYQPFGDTNRLDADPDQRLKNGQPNPFVTRFFMDGPWLRIKRAERADNYRATLSHEMDLGNWGSYRLAGMSEYEVRKLDSRKDIEVVDVPSSPTAGPEGAANQVYRRNYVTEGAWNTYYVDGPPTMGLLVNQTDAFSGQTFSSKWVAQNANPVSDPSKQQTYLIGGQARYLSGRLIAGFGYRRDIVDYLDRDNVRNPVNGEWEVDWTKGTQFHWTGETRTYSAVGHLTKKISLLYNLSSNIALPNNVRILPLNTVAPPAKGEGHDVGVIFSLLEDKVYARATYYHSAQKGAADFRFGGGTGPQAISGFILNTLQTAHLITQAENDAHHSTASGGTYDRTSKGYEFTLTANLIKNLRLQANYSITNTTENNTTPEIVTWMAQEFAYYNGFPGAAALVTTDQGRTIAQEEALMQTAMDQSKELDGLGTSGARKYKISAFARYTFASGFLKGAFLGGGYRHQSKNLVGRDPVTREVFYGNSYWLADAVLGYRFQHVPFVKRLNLQLNVTNVFDDRKNLVLRLRTSNPDKPTVIFNPDAREVQRYAIQAPRTWRLSTDFEF